VTFGSAGSELPSSRKEGEEVEEEYNSQEIATSMHDLPHPPLARSSLVTTNLPNRVLSQTGSPFKALVTGKERVERANALWGVGTSKIGESMGSESNVTVSGPTLNQRRGPRKEHPPLRKL
jgi:hypothetical protein